ncbi:hypothetical protein WA026_004516 [Henosepilachna vigintioctopunctata]|uniref:Uncharacterized protein n=1 Tax=Henosepilachna vigintioctopunctata TaxID=420089 RepID=A0AAW1V0P6_9CUCU
MGPCDQHRQAVAALEKWSTAECVAGLARVRFVVGQKEPGGELESGPGRRDAALEMSSQLYGGGGGDRQRACRLAVTMSTAGEDDCKQPVSPSGKGIVDGHCTPAKTDENKSGAFNNRNILVENEGRVSEFEINWPLMEIFAV